jgi:hypothetical protein
MFMAIADIRRQRLQREANKWLRRFRTQGLDVPGRVRVHTNLRQFDKATRLSLRSLSTLGGWDLHQHESYQ